MINSKQGKPLSTDGCPGLARDPQRVFGESPVKRPITGRHPNPTRADDAETDNLKQAVSPSAPTR
jgi:hypothetical protein